MMKVNKFMAAEVIQLRDYQEKKAKQPVLEQWARGVRSVGLILPTGGGKTVVFSSIAHDHDGGVAAIVHRKEIVQQISIALAKLDVKHRIVAPAKTVKKIRRKHIKIFGKSYIDPHAEAGVCSVQTLTSKANETREEVRRWIEQVTLAIFDEGHHYVKSGIWSKAVESFDHARLLFVTATPRRADGKGLGSHADGYIDVLVEGPTTHWLQENGYLSRFVYKAPPTDFDASQLSATSTGDFSRQAMRKAAKNSHIVGDVVKQYREFAHGKKAILFATDVESSEDMRDAFIAAGYRAAALSGDTDADERDEILEAFEEGRYDVLCNVDLFDEGFDVPAVEVVIMARPTLSLAKYLQMVGRALRPVYADGYDLSTAEGRLAAMAAGPKPHAIVIDPVRNWERLGTMPNWPQQWSLDGKSARGGSGGGEVRQIVCVGTEGAPGCTQPYPVFHACCPYCGAPKPEPAGRKQPEQVDGVLVDLDVEGWAALLARIQAADMDDDAFTQSQIQRHVPAVGRARELKAHQAGRYRRKVLRELVAWWMGCHPPERTKAERQARFYARFGIDVGTAFTLDAAKTDKLIEAIQKRFTEDFAA